MWDKETGRKIAAILSLVSDPPNLRSDDHDPSVQIFDGGTIMVQTGLMIFQLSDGTRAVYGTGLNIGLSITFPQGERISIDSSFHYCSGCLTHISPSARFCHQCG